MATTDCRKNSRDQRPTALADNAIDDQIDQWNEFEALERAELVHQTLESLSSEHREVLTLRFLEELDLPEIAEVTRSRFGMVKPRLHSAKRELKSKLKDGELPASVAGDSNG